jgi:hypothetical protein
VGFDNLRVVLFVDGYFDLALLFIWCGQHGYIWVWTQGANTLGVETSVNGVYQSQVGKVIDINSVFKDYHHPIKCELVLIWFVLVFAKFHCLHKRFETELSDALELMVVPEQNLVHGEFRMSSSAN